MADVFSPLPLLFSGRRASGRAFRDRADAYRARVSSDSECASPRPSIRVTRDLARGMRGLRRGSVCALRAGPVRNPIGQSLGQEVARIFDPAPTGGADHSARWRYTGVFEPSFLQSTHAHPKRLLSHARWERLLFSSRSRLLGIRQSNARVTQRRRVAHLGVHHNRTSSNPPSSPSKGFALHRQDASAHGGQRRRTGIRRALPRRQGRFPGGRGGRAAAAASMRALPTPSSVRIYPTLVPLRDGPRATTIRAVPRRSSPIPSPTNYIGFSREKSGGTRRREPWLWIIFPLPPSLTSASPPMRFRRGWRVHPRVRGRRRVQAHEPQGPLLQRADLP